MKKLDNRTSEYDHEINILKKLASCIEGYIHVQRLNHHIIDEHYWINFFSDEEDFKTAELDESKQELFSRYFLEIYYNYFQGLIMNAEENIIAIGIFQKYLNSIIKLQNQFQITFFLLVYAYLYYLGYEEKMCIPELKEFSKILLKKNIQRMFFIDCNISYMR